MPTFFNTPDPKKPTSAAPAETAPAFRTASPTEATETPQSQPAMPLSTDGSAAPEAEAAAPVVEGHTPEIAAPASEGVSPASEGASSVTENAALAVPDAAPAPPPAFRTPPSDGVVIRHFRTAEAGSLGKLRGDFELDLTPALFERLKRYFSDTAKRDPTAGELRLLAALDSRADSDPSRLAVGELITDSATLAEVWSDMMAKHGALHGAGNRCRNKKTAAAPPCTLSDALSLSGHYLARLHELNAGGDVTVLASPSDENAAIAAGLTPVAKLRVGEGFRSVWRAELPPLESVPERAGDLLLYLPRVDFHRLTSLLACLRKESRPVLGAICAVVGTSLLASLLRICRAADLYPDRIRMNLFPQSAPTGRVPVSLLCDPVTPAEDGTADYLLRVPLKQTNRLSELIKSLGLNAVVCGRVRANERTLIYVRGTQGNTDIPAAELPEDILRGMSAPRLRSYTIREGNAVPAVTRPPVALLPSPIPALNGLTPDRREAVALTASADEVLTTPSRDLLLSAAEVIVAENASGYTAAMEAVRTAVSPLLAQHIPNRRITLSVSLTATHPDALTAGMTLELLCGLYRAAAEGGLPIVDPAIEVKAADTAPAYRLTVVAYARIGESVGGSPAEGEPLRYLLPVLRRSYENSLKALSTALSRDEGAVCVIHPVVMQEIEVEIPAEAVDEVPAEAVDEAPAEVPSPAKEVRHVPDLKSVEELAAKLTEEPVPIFSMSEEDTRLLLAQTPIAHALTERIAAGRTVAVLGESCKPFAELGLLPAALTRLSDIPAPASVTAEYRHGASPALRLPRASLLIPAGDNASHIPCLMTLRLPDGTVIPDGFTDGSGRVLGLLNGMDTTVLPLLRPSAPHTDPLF